uniref:RING-type E3 ubiquitin transferase n=1 Tax=Lepeophtheirus salmonis TaxID=72036 RepID=A0A0K2TTY8_LEPSM
MSRAENSNCDFLDLSDAVCPICLYIFVEPILLPCQHRLCGPCFHSNLELTSLSCPLCKKRVGTWARRNKKLLIDVSFWKRVQKEFPNEVNARLQGTDNTDYEAFLTFPHHQFASEGEIRKEFESEMDKFHQEAECQRTEEETKSKEFIELLLKEEQEKKREELQRNEELSKELIQKLAHEEEMTKEDKKNEIISKKLIHEMTSPRGQLKAPSPRRSKKKPRQLSLKESLARASRVN